jgi:hypothetical protein
MSKKNNNVKTDIPVVSNETQETDFSVESSEAQETQETDIPVVSNETQEIDFSEVANNLMGSQGVQNIWRCPKYGYWFSREDNAKQHAHKTGVETEHYTLTTKSE